MDACSRGLFRGRSESTSNFRFFNGSDKSSEHDDDEGLAEAAAAPDVAPSHVLLLLLLGTVDSGVLDFIR